MPLSSTGKTSVGQRAPALVGMTIVLRHIKGSYYITRWVAPVAVTETGRTLGVMWHGTLEVRVECVTPAGQVSGEQRSDVILVSQQMKSIFLPAHFLSVLYGFLLATRGAPGSNFS